MGTNAHPGGLRVAITGGGGFIGKRLAEMLAREPGVAETRVLVRRQTGRGNAVVARLDSPAELRGAFQGCSAVVHCAFDYYDMAANLGIAQVLADACLKAGARLVHLSTAAVYEPFPDGSLDESGEAEPAGLDYKDTKIAIERELLRRARTDGLGVVILQPTIVYGPSGGAWTDSPVRELLTGQVVLPDEGKGLCNAVFVDDVCRAAIAALAADVATGERFLISGPQPVEWREFLGAYEAMLGVRSLRSVSRTELPLPSLANTSGSGQGGGRSPVLRAVKRAVARRLGAGARSRLSIALKRTRTLVRGEAVHVPTGLKLALYAARCTVRIDKARWLLGYEPQFDLAHGMAATLPYVQQVYGSHGRGKASARTVAR
ncbi:MAG: NAD-dependent epimerase/dehydratase family protein [Acetobacteraceae bacterium]|nr:NAD-dependent epimerase/dehydratase family protein [Acetobacteraceae bacterium]